MKLTPHARWTTPSLILLSLGPLVPLSAARAESKIEYNRDVRPILAENCFACHGPDSAARKANLRLDQREQAIKAGIVVPGKPDNSVLIERIFSDDSTQVMPPRRTKKKLTSAQKETLKRWITDGAEYQPHWSLTTPKRPLLPGVKNADWIRNPIDRFILAALEKCGLQPAPEADRSSLARRLSLDLTGLPPHPTDVEAFVNDKQPDAYERFVDKLLDSPHWGEHRGRYWLDAARYADTHGIHIDNYREIWAYRDWVINAFNRNSTFDRFTIEQLAGDLLPNRTLDQQVASGFNRCNITSNEGGLIEEEYLVLYTRDRTETTSRVWLGLTANCAVCHDHKFDPLSQKEFYSMSAFFNNTTQGAMDGNSKDTPPIVTVPRMEDRPRWDALREELAEARKRLNDPKQSARADFDKWLAEVKPEQIAALVPGEGLHFHAGLSEGTGGTVHLTVEGKQRETALVAEAAWDAGYVAEKAFKSRPGSVLDVADAGDFERNKGFSYGAWVKLTKSKLSGAIFARMDDQHDYRGWDLWVQDGRVGAHIIHKWQEDALKVVSNNPVQVGQWNHLFITYDGSGRPEGVKVYVNGALQKTTVEARGLKNTIRTKVPLKVAQRHTASCLDGIVLQDMRLYGRTLTAQEVDRLVGGTRVAWLLSKLSTQRSQLEKNELFDGWWLLSRNTIYQGLSKKVGELEREESAIKAHGTVAHVMQERKDEPTAHVLFRGEYDKRRDRVKASTPKALPPMPADLPRNRLGFARWLLRPENPLTTRVTVNRFWQEIFGVGIVRTSDDFGISGELPSNPELLDWLAVEFRESGWDVKRFFKLLVTSAAYRQVVLMTPEKEEKDPDNRLLSRGPRFRMDAEMVRDYALAASGLLVRKLGGPSVKPYQPEGVWEAVAMLESNTRNYQRDSGAKLYRRSLYTFWKRSAPPASMDIFNAPARETCTVRRERTNTPLQALVTLNDPQFIEAARYLAQTTLKQGGDKIDFMARRLLCRPLRTEEVKVVQTSLDDLLAYFKAHDGDAKKLLAVGEAKVDLSLDVSTLAAWTMLANALLNLDEVLNK
jgi:Protein of unknown function (DUF1553)/Protein of unknown function (DUF1549)/Concanavalin A-like lectin/glucanases superfamily/Planctomycete cytochrome C